MSKEFGFGKYRFDVQIWIIFLCGVIGAFGFTVVFPFFAIYLSQQMGFGEVLTGVVMMGYMATGTFFMLMGGAWADKFGRKRLMVLSLGLESILLCFYAFLSDFWGFMIIALAEGAIGSLYSPAANAMVADIVPSNRRPQAYSLIRISFNSGTAVGPLVGGLLLIAIDLRYMFLISGLAVGIAALLILFRTRETLSKKKGEEFRYKDLGVAARDRSFIFFTILMAATFFIYAQTFSALPVYGTVDLGIPMTIFALVFALNGAMVVLLQIPITNFAVKFRRTTAMAIGQAMMAIGFGIVFFATDFAMMVVAIIVFTFGELFHAAVQYALVADMAPERIRGTYMGFAGLAIGIGDSIGMFTGLMLLGTLPDRSFTWLIIMLIGLPTAFGYYRLRKSVSENADKGLTTVIHGKSIASADPPK